MEGSFFALKKPSLFTRPILLHMVSLGRFLSLQQIRVNYSVLFDEYKLNIGISLVI